MTRPTVVQESMNIDIKGILNPQLHSGIKHVLGVVCLQIVIILEDLPNISYNPTIFDFIIKTVLGN